jgi:hypothetical protein
MSCFILCASARLMVYIDDISAGLVPVIVKSNRQMNLQEVNTSLGEKSLIVVCVGFLTRLFKDISKTICEFLPLI